MQATQTIEQFYQSALELLSEPASSQLPTGSRFHPAAVPAIVVHAGPVRDLPQIRRELPENSFLLGFYEATETLTDSYFEGRTLLHPISSASDCVGRVSILAELYPNQVAELIATPDFRARYSDECDSIENAVVVARENAESNKQRGLIRLRCGCANLHRMLKDQPLFPKKVSATQPVVLCGAGPSLTRHIDELKAVKDQVVITAVGHAVKVLTNAGIVPDIIFECDSLAGQNWPADLSPQSVLVAGIDVDPSVPARFQQVCWMAGSSMPMNKVAEEHGYPLAKVTLGKTISVQALDFLQRMGFRRIALVGQDYCLTASGQTHAGEAKSASHDYLFDVPGALGGMVTTNYSFKSLLDGMNGYISALPDRSDLELINLSGGAAIECSSAQAFGEWASALEPEEKGPLFAHQDIDFDSDMLHSTVRDVRTAMREIEAVVKASRALNNELNRHPIRMDRVRAGQKKLETAIQQEALFRGDAGCADLLHTLFIHTDSIFEKIPGMVSEEQDPAVQLNYLSRRYGFIKRLCDDVISCLEEGGDPCCFEAFNAENVRALKQANPAFLDAVEQARGADRSSYHFLWLNQLVPHVRREVEGEWEALSANSSIYVEAADVVERFVQAEQFNPQTDGLTILAPGNWVYVLEFLRRYPHMPLAIIEPWPELLAAMLDRGCFLNQLSEGSIVVQTWADPIYMKRRGEWNARGLRQKLFISPHVATMPDVDMLARNMEMLP